VIRQVVPGYEQLNTMVLAFFEARVPLGASVLVVGAGTGSELVAFGWARPEWRLTGVEPSAQMADFAVERLRAAGLGGRVQLHRGYAHDLPAEPAFDAATLISVMHFLPDDGAKLSLLESIASRLRPGAPFALMDANGEPGTPEHEELMAAWMAFVRLQGMTPEEQEEYAEQVRTGVHWTSERRTRELLAEAGFVDVRLFYRGLLFGAWVATRA
jgi:tRNA (cmo5U34)-methyltransferase